MDCWIQMMEASLGQDPERQRIQRITAPETFVADPHRSAPLAPYAAGARVVIVSGLRLLRDGLADALTRTTGISVVAAVPDSERARLAIVDHEPSLVLIDIALRDSLALVRAMNSSPRAPRVVVFAVSDSDDALLPYIEAGIHGYVARDGSLADVVTAVESAGRGETIVSPKL